MSAIAKKLTELAFKSAEWNARKLPENTLDMQLAKVEEEIEEVRTAFDKGLIDEAEREIADVFLAIGGIIRFDKSLFFHMLVDFTDGLPTSFERLAELAEEKLAIIEERPYEIINGVYRHPTLH